MTRLNPVLIMTQIWNGFNVPLVLIVYEPTHCSATTTLKSRTYWCNMESAVNDCKEVLLFGNAFSPRGSFRNKCTKLPVRLISRFWIEARTAQYCDTCHWPAFSIPSLCRLGTASFDCSLAQLDPCGNSLVISSFKWKLNNFCSMNILWQCLKCLSMQAR